MSSNTGIFVSGKERPNLISLILDTKSEKHVCFVNVYVVGFAI